MSLKLGCKFLIAATMALALATGASAFSLQQGDNVGHLTDYGSFFDSQGNAKPTLYWDPGLYDGTDLTTGVVNLPQEGEQIRTVLRVDDLAITGEPSYYSGVGPELYGLVYDLQVTEVFVETQAGDVVVTVRFGSAGNYSQDFAGRFDLWARPGDDGWVDQPGLPDTWQVAANPGAYDGTDPFAAGVYDVFPGINDDAFDGAFPVMGATLVPRVEGGTTLITHVYTLTGDDAGTGLIRPGFLHTVYNNMGLPLAGRWLDGRAEVRFFANLSFWPEETGLPFDDPTNPPNWWNARSKDPLEFTAIPEPGSLALVGLGLASLSGVALKRRRKGASKA